MPTSTISGLSYELLFRGSYAMLQVSIPMGHTVKAEAGAMVGMSDTIELEGKLEGGIFGGIKRMIAGEKFFFQTLAARKNDGVAFLAPSMPGDISALELDGAENYIVAKDGFLASSETIVIDATMQNLARGLFSGEGFFVLKATGRGTLFLSSYGAIEELDIPAGEQFVIDNGHLVAWPERMQYTIEKASKGWISSFTSGEGLVTRFFGPGKVLIQSRTLPALVSWLAPHMPSSGS